MYWLINKININIFISYLLIFKQHLNIYFSYSLYLPIRKQNLTVGTNKIKMNQNLILVNRDENDSPKLTVSNLQLAQSNDLHTLCAQNNTPNIIKKVTSLNYGDLKQKNKNNVDHNQKAFNAKLNVYAKEQKTFRIACNSLVKSYETIKKMQSDSIPDKNGIVLEDIQTTVNMICFS